MKTLKHALLVIMFLGAFSNIKAQCGTVLYSYNNGGGGIGYSVYWDSVNVITSGYIDFGDGDTSTSFYGNHTYTSSGTYNVCLHYTGSLCSDSACQSVTVDVCNFNPSITYTGSYPDYTFSIYNAPVGATYSWTIMDSIQNTLFTSTQASPTFALPYFHGFYLAYVTVTLQNGCVDSSGTYLYVQNPCIAYISYNQPTATDISFSGYPMDSAGANQFNYSWNFGDGNSSNIENPTHNYGGSGTWNVCLIVTGLYCADTICQNVTVNPPSFYIEGNIYNGGTGACNVTIFLIQEDSAGHLALVDERFAYDSLGGGSCSGAYYFSAQQGTYYVKAALDSGDVNYANYLPTYYGDVLTWGSATAINLNQDVYNVNVNLIAGTNPGGPGFVGGWVSQGAGMVMGGHGSRGVGDPLPDIQINLLTSNDVPVASTRTDVNGRYTFSNLALGTYKIYAEEINKVPYPMNVTLTGNNPSQNNVNVTVNSNSATTGIDDLHDIQVVGIFPNPVSDKATIAVSLKRNSKVKMMLTDLAGRVVLQKTQDLNSGINETQIDLRNQAAGVYELSLSNGADKKVLKLVKVN